MKRRSQKLKRCVVSTVIDSGISTTVKRKQLLGPNKRFTQDQGVK
jgi:hypothetical protein